MLKLPFSLRSLLPALAIIFLSLLLAGCGDSDEDEKRKNKEKEKAKAEQRQPRNPEEMAMFRVQKRFLQVKAQMQQMEKDIELQKAHHATLKNDLQSIYDELQSAELRGFRFGDINTTEILAIEAQNRQTQVNEKRRENLREDRVEDREEEENRVLTTVIILILLLSIVVFFAKIFMDRKNQAPTYPVYARDANDTTAPVEPAPGTDDTAHRRDDDQNPPVPPTS